MALPALREPQRLSKRYLLGNGRYCDSGSTHVYMAFRMASVNQIVSRRMIYHVLPESEPLSAERGGALAHTVANLMKIDPMRVAVCPSTDSTWGFDAGRIITVPGLSAYGRLRARQYYPLWVLAPLVRRMFQPMISRLVPGDVVWVHNRPVFSAALSSPVHQKGAKIAYQFHDALGVRIARRCFAEAKPDAVIFVSDFLRRYWVQHVPDLKNTHVIHNGADAEQFFPAAAESIPNPIPVILFVGRLHPTKGAHVLLDALRILNERGVRAKCRIVGSAYSGDSKSTPYVEQISLNCSENVEFRGHCAANELAVEYRTADVLCCPSICQEAFGKVNVEAMACGLPVVASSVGGIPEIAAHGGVRLVHAGNAEEMADALQEILTNPQLRAKLSREARASFEKHFTWSGALAHYKQIAASLESVAIAA